MGLSQSSEGRREEIVDEEEEEEHRSEFGEVDSESEVDEIQQEPELLPCEASASPLSPHNPSLRAWPEPLQGRAFHGCLYTGTAVDYCAEVHLICHGESNANTRTDLIAGRCPSAALTAQGKRQARALGVFLLSQGVHFDAAYASPLERCKQTAVSVCQELNFPAEKIELSNALIEMGQGRWEGLQHSEVYTAELLDIMINTHPDFHAPEGESQRQVEYRMIEFLNNHILPQAIRKSCMTKSAKGDNRKLIKENGKPNSLRQVHPLSDDGEIGMVSKGSLWSIKEQPSGREMHKSRLQVVSVAEKSKGRIFENNGKLDVYSKPSNGSIWTRTQEEQANSKLRPYYVGIFSHAVAIKCLLRGLLGSDPRMTHHLCIDNTSVTVLRYSCRKGWQIQRINDSAHLCLL